MQQRLSKTKRNKISAASHDQIEEDEMHQGLVKPFFNTRAYRLPKKEVKNVLRARVPRNLKRFSSQNNDSNKVDDEKTNETKIQINKPISKYSEFEDLDFDTDLPFYVRFESDLLPLCYFDDDDYETVDFHKLRDQIKRKEITTGNSILLKSFELTWVPVLILDFCEDHSTFLIEYVDNDIRKYVGRLNLQISSYDNDSFFQRRKEAIKRREVFIRNQRFFAYLDYKLNPNQSILTQKVIQRILSLVPNELKTNFQRIANLIREIKMIDVFYFFTEAYKNRLKEDEKFVKKCLIMNFPILNDFEPHYEIKQRSIQDSTSFHELAQKMIGVMKISTDNAYEETMKIKIRARILSELKLFEIDFNDHNVMDFTQGLKVQINSCVNIKFVKKMRKMLQRIRALPFFDENLAHCIDKIIINSISEVTLNAIDDLYESFANGKIYFVYNYSYFNPISFDIEIKNLLSVLDSITQCWKKAACRSTFTIFSSEDEILLPNSSLLSLHLQRLKSYLNYTIKGQFDEIQDEINKFFNRFSDSYLIESFDPTFRKKLTEIDVDSYVSKVACSGSFIPASRMLSNRQVAKLEVISNKLTNDSIQIIPTKINLIRLNVKVFFRKAKEELISKINSMNNHVKIILFLHTNSLIEQLQATLQMTYDKVSKEPNNIAIFLELRSFYKEVPLILKKLEKKKNEVSNIINFFESSCSPLVHVLNQRFFDFRFKMHLFVESFPLRESQLKEAKEDISTNHASIEADVLNKIAQYENDLNFILQQNVKDNITEMCIKTKETYDNFKSLEPVVLELNLGKGVLLHHPFDQGRFERSLSLSHDMNELWEMVRGITDLNVDIASFQIQELNVRSLFEKCRKWSEEQQRIRESILYYPIARNLADKLANTIKEFTNYLSIIEVITSPLLRQRHISMINDLFASNPDNCVDSSSTFYELISVKILDLKDKFAEIYEIAKSESQIEKEIRNIINELLMLSVKLKIKNLKEFLINTQDLINRQQKELNEIKKSKFSVHFLERIELHLKLISDLSNVFSILNKNVKIYYELKLFITAEDTKKRNPSLFESFKTTRTEFSKVLQSIKYVNILPTKEAVFHEILSNFSSINERLPVYIFNRKSEYIRFSILTNEEFFNFISSTHSIKDLSPKIRYILPNVSSFLMSNGNQEVENNGQLFIEGVKSFDDEVMYLNEPVQYTIDKVDFLFENVIKSIRKTIQSQVLLLVNRNFQYFLKQLPQLPFQVSFLYLNIRFTEIVTNKENITNFEQLQANITELQLISSAVNENIQSENTKKSLDSLIDYFTSILRQIVVINGWMSNQNNTSSNLFDYMNRKSNDDQSMEVNKERKLKRNLNKSHFQKRVSMYSISFNPILATKREKTPKFIKFVVDNDKIFIKAKKFSIEYQFEYMGNNYDAMNCPTVYNVENFLESISYNNSCSIPSDSLTADNFLFHISVLSGRQLLSIHLDNKYFMSNYKDFLKCIELNNSFILHFNEFGVVPTSIQCDVTEFVENNKIKGILVASDSMFPPLHFTYLRPIIVSKINDKKIKCIYGCNEQIKKEKVKEYSNSNHFEHVLEIKNLNELIDFEITEKVVWFRCHFSQQMLSVFEQNPFILVSNGSRIFFNKCDFIFDFISKENIPKSIGSLIQWISTPALNEEFNFLIKIVGSYEPIEFCLEHASRIPLISSNKNLTKSFVYSLLKEIFPSKSKEINELIKDETNGNKIDLIKLIKILIENKMPVILIGHEKKIEMIQKMAQFFNQKSDENKIDLFINLVDFENSSQLFIDLVDDSKSISFENGRFCQFLPFSIDSQIESKIFETNVLDEAYQYLSEHFVLFSLFCGFNESPSKASIKNYLIMPPDQIFSEYFYDLLARDFEHVTFIFIQCQSYQFSSIFSFDWTNIKIDKLINIRIILITPLIKSDFEYFCGSISPFKLICQNNQISLLKSRLLNHQTQSLINQRIKENKIILDENYKKLSEKQVESYFPLYLKSFKEKIEKRTTFLSEFLNSFSSSLEFEEKCNNDFNNATQFLSQCNIDLENAKSQLSAADSALKNEIEITNGQKNEILKPKLENEEHKRDQIAKEIQSKIPSLQKAEKFMSSIDQTTVFMIRGIRSPTPSVLPIFECFAIIFNIKPDSKLVGKNRIIDYFPPVQKMMKDSKFFITMLTFSKQNIELEKVTRLKALLDNSKTIMERSIKNNKDFSAIVKWFKCLVSSNEIRNELNPLYESLEIHKKEVNSIQREIECINQKVEDRKKTINDIKSSITKLMADIKNAEHQLVIINSRKTSTIHFNQELKEEVLHFQNEYEMLSEKLLHANDICFARAFCVCYSSSLFYDDHLKSRKLYGRSFNLEMNKETQRKLHLNGINDQVLKEKMSAILDEFTTPIIYDPDGICFKLLREVFTNAQVIFGFQELEKNLPTIAIIENLRESLFVKDFYSKSFIIIKASPASINFPDCSLSKHFIFVDFSIPNSFEIFRENLFVSLHESNFESISKFDDQIDEINSKKISIIEKINTSLKKNPLEFFEGGSWKNCLSFFADTKSSIGNLLKDMNRIKEITFQSDEFSRITAKFSQDLFNYLRKIIECNPSSAVLPIMIDIVNTCHKPIEIFEKVKQVFQLSYQYSFENINVSFIGNEFAITFPKFILPVDKTNKNNQFEKFDKIEKNVQKKLNDYKNQFFRFSEEIQVNSEELIDFSINEKSKLSLKKIILSISSHFPIVIKAPIQDDPTNYIFKLNQCKNIILTKEYDSNLLRFNGWLIARYPDKQDDGFSHLKEFLSELFTCRQYPQKFRFIIIIEDSTKVPFYLSQTSIIMNLPALLPPSKIYSKIIKRVDDKMMNAKIKESIQIVSNFVGSLSLFSRPTIVADVLKQKFLDVMKIKSAALLPDRLYYIKQMDNVWQKRVMSLKKLKKQDISFNFSYASISLVEVEGAFPIDSISSLDCEVQNGSFIKVKRFYPIPLGRVWIKSENGNDNDNRFNSVLFGGNPVSIILSIKLNGDSNCHFLLEQ